MKKSCLMVFVFLVLAGTAYIYAAPKMHLAFGPRVGFTYVAAPAAEFSTMMQQYYDDSIDYITIMSQFGLNLEQRISLGTSDSHFAIQEIVLISGLDQNLIIPSISVLIGFRSGRGLEIGLGPSVNIKGGTETVTVVYAVGWTIAFNDVYIPINLVVLPTPADGFPRFGLVTGFNFFIGKDPY